MVSRAMVDSRLSAFNFKLYAVRSTTSPTMRSPFFVMRMTFEPMIRGLVRVAGAASLLVVRERTGAFFFFACASTIVAVHIVMAIMAIIDFITLQWTNISPSFMRQQSQRQHRHRQLLRLRIR